MSSRKNMAHYGVKQEMSGEKNPKKAKNPVCFSCWKTVLKLLQLFWFKEAEFDPLILTYIDSDSYEEGWGMICLFDI